jgi:tetratricopeptide (TPR) repeat protein
LGTTAVYLSLASSYLYQWGTQCDDDPKALEMAFEMAKKYMTMTGKKNSTILGWVYSYRKQHDLAIADVKKVISRAPESLIGYTYLAGIYNFLGRPNEAIELAEKALQIYHKEGPIDYYIVSTLIESGIATLKNVFDHIPLHYESFRAHLNLAILYAESNQIDKAGAEAAEILKLSPNFSVKVYGERIPYKDPAQAERDMAALRKAGLK